MENPSVVEGIPFVTMKVTPMVTHRAKVDLRPDSGRIIVNWRVDSTIDIEEDEVRLRGVDFAPMLLAWIEQERSKRRV
jgi:hypothetical protein